MVDTLPPAVFNVPGAAWTCAITAGSGACGAPSGTGNLSTTVNLVRGSIATYTITAPILPSATGTIVNTAIAGVPAGASDPNPANNVGTDADTLLSPTGDLAITKTDGTATYTPGSTVMYTIVATNAGPSDVTGATVTDAVTALPQVASATWYCVGAGGATCASDVSGNIADTINLPAGGTVTYTLVVTLRPCATGQLANTASIMPPDGTTDPNGANNVAIDTDAQGTPLNCDDGSACTTDDHCSDGACHGTLIDCDDSNICTLDVCLEPAGTCDHSQASGTCNIIGVINYYRDNQTLTEPSTKPVPGERMLRVSSSEPTAISVTDASGQYQFLSEVGNITLTAQALLLTDEMECRSAIAGADASLMARTSVLLYNPTPAQRVAGDVSGNGTVDSYDAALTAMRASSVSCVRLRVPDSRDDGLGLGFLALIQELHPDPGWRRLQLPRHRVRRHDGQLVPHVLRGGISGQGRSVRATVPDQDG